MSFSVILLIIVAVAVITTITIYNKLVTKRAMADEAYSGIDVQLKRRFDLVPNLVETVKGYMGHEASTFEKITAMRAGVQQAGTDADRFKAEAGLTKALSGFFAVAENYPQLRASENFNQLQSQMTQLESDIQMSRRYYNGAVRELNIAIEQFPSNIFAQIFNFQKKPYFELEDEAERENVKVSFK